MLSEEAPTKLYHHDVAAYFNPLEEKKMKCIFSDQVVFPIFEIAFFLLLIFAVLKEYGYFQKKTGVTPTVRRGEQSWNKFNLAFGISSVVLMQIINSANSFNNYKTIISISNLAMLIYLSYFNCWFRNKIIGFINKSQTKEEK